ncbi:aminotransferase class III-fold pyridoxal phosphate-dependent enzyme [Inquilinus sp.]|uniref:aminotransferase class III-fold pyridoxal phosphate-dependent enzyme n=1 Tax=Inquilinus sp. TaxID=1932117 RepID=UPI0031D171EC
MLDVVAADAAIRALLSRHWDVAGTLVPLPGEHDANFRVTAPDGRGYLLKLHAAGTADAEAEMQAAVLAHLAARDPGLPVQRAVPAGDGRLVVAVEVAGRRRLARLTAWLDGTMWADRTGIGDEVRAGLGAMLGRLDRALADFRHPAAARAYAWDLLRAAEQRDALGWIPDPDSRTAATAILDRFAAEIVPQLAACPRQVLHNDANDRNLLLDAEGRIAGLVDFGDMVETARVSEIAVAAAYAAIGAPDPVAAILPLVAAYHEANPLEQQEIDVIHELVLARLAVSLCMAARQSRAAPDNAYLLVSQDDVRATLARFAAQDRHLARMRIREACGLAPNPAAPGIVRWLEANAHRFAPVLETRPAADQVAILDWDRHGANAGILEELTDPAALSAWCERQLAQGGATVGIGRYREDRPVYRAAHFETPDPAERRSIHLGLDLFAPAGTPIRAPIDGVVEAVGDEPAAGGFGGHLLLRHATDDGTPFWTLYGHLRPTSLAGLAPGRAVAAGDRIAVLGDLAENGHWPPHLHLQLLTHLLEMGVGIWGVAPKSQLEVWESISPDPNIVAGIPASCSAVPDRTPARLRQLRRRVVGRSLSLSYRDPLKIVGGRGARLIDEAGREWLDMVNNVAHVGHGHPRVVAAAQAQMARLNTNTRYLHDHLVEYARRLTATLPAPLSVCFLVNSGSEANDLAIRLARAHTGRHDLLTLDHAYHGHLTSLIEISPYKFAGPGGQGRPSHVHVCEMPDLYRGRFRAGDPEVGARYAEDVGRQAAAARARGGVAAFFCESILGCGGQLVLPDGYLKAAYAHVRAAGGLCVADEVQVGFGRAGSHMWAFETQGVVPDIVTMGKPIGNGHPMAAVVTTPEIAAAFANGMEYFNTFGGNPVSAAIGLAVLDVIRDERLMHHAAVIGARMVDGLRDLSERHPMIGNVRGLGLFLGVEMVRDRRTLEPAAPELSALVEAMKTRHGILLSTEGPHHNVLKIKPPLAFDAADCDRFLAALGGELNRLELTSV